MGHRRRTTLWRHRVSSPYAHDRPRPLRWRTFGNSFRHVARRMDGVRSTLWRTATRPRYVTVTSLSCAGCPRSSATQARSNLELFCCVPRRDATRRDATRRDATRRDATRRDATRRDATRLIWRKAPQDEISIWRDSSVPAPRWSLSNKGRRPTCNRNAGTSRTRRRFLYIYIYIYAISMIWYRHHVVVAARKEDAKRRLYENRWFSKIESNVFFNVSFIVQISICTIVLRN